MRNTCSTRKKSQDSSNYKNLKSLKKRCVLDILANGTHTFNRLWNNDSKQEYLIVQKSKVNELELLFSQISVFHQGRFNLQETKKILYLFACIFQDVSSSGLLKTSPQLSLNSFFNIFAFLSLSCFLHWTSILCFSISRRQP